MKSYSTAPADWIFDDGSSFPEKKLFEKVEYNEEKREFSGEINWGQTTTDGDAKWVYKFVFNEAFTMIESGRVTCYDRQGLKEIV